MSALWSDRLARAQFVLLCAFAVVLPILEAPKNIIFALLVLTWCSQRIAARDFVLRRPDPTEASLLFLVGASLVSTAVNWPFPNGTKGLRDVFMQVFIFWLIYRTDYSDSQRMRIMAMIAAGVVIGLVWGVVDVALGKKVQLEFHSAGIVTQSALYLGIVLVATLSVVWFAPRAKSTKAAPSLWWAAAVLMTAGLFMMGSRGAILAVLLTCLVCAAAIGQRRVWIVLVGSMTLAAVTVAVLPDWFNQSRWLAKVKETVATRQLVSADQERLDNWRIAFAQIAQGDSTVFGIGPRNFSSIDFRELKFDAPITLASPRLNHAHNLFLNKLVEEGVVGLAAMLNFLGLIALQLMRDWRATRQRAWRWFSAVGALLVPVLGGMVGTPWYLEHALVAMTVLALYSGANRVEEAHAADPA